MADKKKPTAKRKAKAADNAKKTTPQARTVKINKQTPGTPKIKSHPLKQSEEANQQANATFYDKEFYQQLIDNMEDCLTVFDADGTILFANRKAADHLLGLVPSAVISKNISQFVPQVQSEEMIERYRRVITTGQPLEQEVIFTLQGVDRWFMNTLKHISFGVHNIPAVVSISRDITEYKQEEQKTKKFRKFNNLILSAAGEGIYGLDMEGNTIFINPAAARMVGWQSEELIGLNEHNVLHHSKKDGSPYSSKECPIYAALKDGKVHRIDNEVFWRKDGSSFPVEYTSTPIINLTGEIEGAVVVFRDITERKNAEKAVRASDNLISSVLRAAPIGIGLVCNRVLMTVNDRICEMVGKKEEELVGKSARVLYPSDAEFEHVGNEKYRQIAERGIGTVETQWQCRDGYIIDVLLTSTPINPLDMAAGVTFTALDITKRKRSEEELRESQQWLETVIETAPT